MQQVAKICAFWALSLAVEKDAHCKRKVAANG
jgi:hypothetical protein